MFNVTDLVSIMKNNNIYKILTNILNVTFDIGDQQKNIRFYHECEGRVEKSVPRIAI